MKVLAMLLLTFSFSQVLAQSSIDIPMSSYSVETGPTTPFFGNPAEQIFILKQSINVIQGFRGMNSEGKNDNGKKTHMIDENYMMSYAYGSAKNVERNLLLPFIEENAQLRCRDLAVQFLQKNEQTMLSLTNQGFAVSTNAEIINTVKFTKGSEISRYVCRLSIDAKNF